MGLSGVCNHTSDLSITRMITDRIGQNEVLLPINHNHYNFRGKIHLGQTSPVGTMSKAKNLEISQFFFRVRDCC